MTKPNRQLAAIMFTDIVGYTRLMGKDSEKALKLVHQSKEIQKPLVEKHDGKWLKEMGDGALAQFSTAIDAVNCAIEIQNKAREEFDSELRIGIHLGDITFEDNDVYGDGVNVASRLESITVPGGVYISDSVEKAIRGLSDVKTTYIGEKNLKNVDYDIRIYALQGMGLPIADIEEKPQISEDFFSELKRRGIYRITTVYLALSFLLIILADRVQAMFVLPDWLSTSLIVVLALFFPLAIYFAWNFEKSPEGYVRTTSKQSIENPLKPSQRKPLTSRFIIVGLLAVILFMYIYPDFLNKDSVTEESIPQFREKSIAVLPFKNLSGSDENLYFSDGVMEAILNNLSMIRDLKVVSRTSVEKYRDQNTGIKEIARELEVANILEGSVQRVGEDVRITVQLISAENDEHIWADNYDRQLTDIFEIQSEIAQTIADNLEVIMTMEERELILNAPTSNMKAYELFLKTVFKETTSEEQILNGIEMIDRVIDLDPEFGLAYAAKGRYCAGLAFYGYSKTIWYDSALNLLNIAIDKNPRDWQPYFGKGLIFNAVHNEGEAIKNLRKTIELNPNNPRAHQLTGEIALKHKDYKEAIESLLKSASLIGKENDQSDQNLQFGYFLTNLDFEQSCENFRKFHDANPEHYDVIQQLVNCAQYYNDNQNALKYALEAIKLRPDFINAKNILAYSYLCLKQYEEAEKYYREMMSKSDQFESHYMIYPFAHRLGYAMLMNGKEEGLSIMETYRDTLISTIKRKEIRAYAIGEYYDLGTIYASLDKKEEALEWLRKAKNKETEGAFFRMDYLNSDPMLDNLRQEPEFQEMLADKREESESVRQIFYEKLSLYHANNELKWLSRK